MLDGEEGPTTKREYEQMMVPGRAACPAWPPVRGARRQAGHAVVSGPQPHPSCAFLRPVDTLLLAPCSRLHAFCYVHATGARGQPAAPPAPPAVGDALAGQVVDFLGRPYPLSQPGGQDGSSSGSSSEQQQPAAQQVPIGTDELLPLLNGQPDMDSREQINEPLLTGVKVGLALAQAMLLSPGA